MTIRRILAAAALIGATLAPLPADAAGVFLCSPRPAGTALNRPVTNPNTTNTYVLNSAGCAVFRSDDATWAVSQGYTPGPNTIPLFFSQQTTGFNFVLPLSAYIKNMIFSELTGNATSSGVCVGTTNGGSDVATMVGTGSTLKAVTDSSLAKRVLSISAPTTVYVGSCAATGFGTSKWDVTVEYGYF